jgi:hypothetical protein
MVEYAVVKDNHLSFNGKNYFRGGSEDVELGSYKLAPQARHLSPSQRDRFSPMVR